MHTTEWELLWRLGLALRTYTLTDLGELDGVVSVHAADANADPD